MRSPSERDDARVRLSIVTGQRFLFANGLVRRFAIAELRTSFGDEEDAIERFLLARSNEGHEIAPASLRTPNVRYSRSRGLYVPHQTLRAFGSSCTITHRFAARSPP